MSGHQSWLSTLLPLAVIGLVLLLRLRNLQKARPLRGAALVALPAIYTVLVGVTLLTLPPSVTGWLCFIGGCAIGAVVGWQRARLMHVDLDQETGRTMIRQSPAALILLLVVAGLRQFLRTTGQKPTPGHALPASALLFTDGLLGFALGMIVAQRVELWRRARALRA